MTKDTGFDKRVKAYTDAIGKMMDESEKTLRVKSKSISHRLKEDGKRLQMRDTAITITGVWHWISSR